MDTLNFLYLNNQVSVYLNFLVRNNVYHTYGTPVLYHLKRYVLVQKYIKIKFANLIKCSLCTSSNDVVEHCAIRIKFLVLLTLIKILHKIWTLLAIIFFLFWQYNNEKKKKRNWLLRPFIVNVKYTFFVMSP